MSLETAQGVFRRGDIWWYRVGRKIRKSSGSTDVRDAIEQRRIVIAANRHWRVKNEWQAYIEALSMQKNNWLVRTHASVRKRSSNRGWQTYLTIEELTTAVLASNGLCSITGLPFARDGINAQAKRDPFSMSLDRIDSAFGYGPGNVRIVLLAVNLAMSHWGEQALTTIAMALAQKHLADQVNLRRPNPND